MSIIVVVGIGLFAFGALGLVKCFFASELHMPAYAASSITTIAGILCIIAGLAS